MIPTLFGGPITGFSGNGITAVVESITTSQCIVVICVPSGAVPANFPSTV